jgi:hypothetical protein
MDPRTAACTALLALAALTTGCGGSKAQSTPSTTGSGYTDGMYLTGRDIPGGTYTSAGAHPGQSGLCTVTTMPHSEGKTARRWTARTNEPITVTLTDDDGMVTIHGCEPFNTHR